ncbi:MAG: prepilin-type N-terminal cleavage/methylation domain-containing protein [Ruminococcaceae bacterium]|nr:prepilin-type N-terminal cleavage/methylation domain-containing protein [Oscillospiraceae bacterium]
MLNKRKHSALLAGARVLAPFLERMRTMCRKMWNIKMLKAHIGKRGKGGFTLVELSVVLALLAILMTMITSFSVLMNGVATENKAEYDFLEDHAMLKETLGVWVAENDVAGSTFKVNEDGTLSVTENEIPKNVSFNDGVLTLGGDQKAGLDAIDGVIFTSNDKLIKCVTYRIARNGKRIEHSFVFSLRCGTIQNEKASYELCHRVMSEKAAATLSDIWGQALPAEVADEE